MLEEIGYAKINLALHVRARRPDGYHEIETLFAFCEDGDRLTLEPRAEGVTLEIDGPFAGALEGEVDNLVLAAARMMRAKNMTLVGAALRLEKRLPVAAGLGGGSADAGATIRLLGSHWGVPPEGGAAELGADVPACVVSRTRVGTGSGTDLAPVGIDDVSGMPVLLVNPRVSLPTGPVFRGWDGVDRGPMRTASALEAALGGRNDLEAPAIALCPPVADVLERLRDTSPLLARMSGSGATCFALYGSTEARDAADRAIAAERPDWWRMASALR